MAAKTLFVLTSAEPGGIPAVEVCESMDECVNSVRFQMEKATPEKVEAMRRELSSKFAWTDDDGTKYSIRKRGGR